MTCEGAYFRITFQIRNQINKIISSIDFRFDRDILLIIKQYLCIIMSLYHVPGLWRLPDVMFARANILWKCKHIPLQTNCGSYWWITKNACCRNHFSLGPGTIIYYHLTQVTKSSQCKRFTKETFAVLLNLNKMFFPLALLNKVTFYYIQNCHTLQPVWAKNTLWWPVVSFSPSDRLPGVLEKAQGCPRLRLGPRRLGGWGGELLITALDMLQLNVIMRTIIKERGRENKNRNPL